MPWWQQLLALLLVGFLLWWLWQIVSRNRDRYFSKSAMTQSASTLGWLALALIGFVALCVLMLRSS